MHPLKNIELGVSGYFIFKFENVDPGEPTKHKWVKLMKESITENTNKYNQFRRDQTLHDFILKLEYKKPKEKDKEEEKQIKSRLFVGEDGEKVTR